MSALKADLPLIFDSIQRPFAKDVLNSSTGLTKGHINTSLRDQSLLMPGGGRKIFRGPPNILELQRWAAKTKV